MRQQLEFRAYDDTIGVPNIVVDGSPNESTVLTLTHWPGIAQPPHVSADLSAQMAFRHLDRALDHPGADFVTNNHFDQDGLVGVHALVDPEASLRHRELLVDVAAAGDFATYRHRAAARASMTIWAYAQPDRSPIGHLLDGPYPEQCRALYETTLQLLLPMVTTPERFRELWVEEDADLAEAETAIGDGTISIVEVADVDLAVVTIGGRVVRGGHRFGSNFAEWVHPMAIHNATRCCRLLLVRGAEFRYIDRYETWVQYQSRRLPRRVDLRPLADELTSRETGLTIWQAAAPSVLTPELVSNGESTMGVAAVQRAIVEHLRGAPAAWNPFEW
jgi:hypothetical protein